MSKKINLEQLNAAVWSGQFKSSLISNELGFSEDEINWIDMAVKMRLNRSFRGK